MIRSARILSLIALFCLTSPTALLRAQNLLINEIMASNSRTLTDADGEYSDWIELYNAGGDSVDLSLYALSDDEGDNSPWALPAVKLAPGQLVLVWAVGSDRADGRPWLAPFKLSKDGESVALFYGNDSLLQLVTYPALESDVAYVRLSSGEWILSDTPTPGLVNSDAERIEVTFSNPPGRYSSSVSVALQQNGHAGVIRYALDGQLPTADSPAFSVPLTVTKNAVIRAAVFDGSSRLSAVSTGQYWIAESSTLPILGLAFPDDSFFSSSTGIYDNWDQEGDQWERAVTVTMAETGPAVFTIDAGVRIHGNITRNADKKSLRLYFRKEYGESSLHYTLFPDQRPDLSDLKRLIVTAPNGDNATGSKAHTLIADALTHALWAKHQGLTSAYKPATLYLNNDYWGVYWLRERIDRYYVQHHLGYEYMDLIHIRPEEPQTEIKEGSRYHFEQTLNFFNTHGLADDSIYQQAAAYFDMDNFIDYYIFNIYAANDDWPQNNVDMVRERNGAHTPWRFIMWDAGTGWSLNPVEMNILEWSLRRTLRTDIRDDWDGLLWSTIFFRRFNENAGFRVRFLNRFMDLMNTTLSPDSVMQSMEQLEGMITTEMSREEVRWPTRNKSWQYNIGLMRNFINQRKGIQTAQLSSAYHAGNAVTVSIVVPGDKGTVTLNSLELDDDFSGQYFETVPVTLSAKPRPGFCFIGWSGADLPDSSVVTVLPAEGLTIEACFESDNLAGSVAINEINYNDSDDWSSGDWLELINIRSETLDLTGWQLTDGGGNVYTFPAGYQLKPGQFCLLVQDSAAFSAAYQSAVSFDGILPFGLSNGGEHLSLTAATGTLVDSLTYDDVAPWPWQADGRSASLALKAPALDNGSAGSWQAGPPGGTPGAFNVIAWNDVVNHGVVINEIAYRPKDDTDSGDWVELYNPTDRPASLQYWTWQTAGQSAAEKLPAAVVVPANGYALLLEDSTRFAAVYGEPAVLCWTMASGLPDNGAPLLLNDLAGTLVDSVAYGIAAPWPYQADGYGATLELREHSLDNSLPGSWQASLAGGTPGAANSEGWDTAVDEFSHSPDGFSLAPAYPNPFNPQTTVAFSLPRQSRVELTVYDMTGRRIMTVCRETLPAGRHERQWEAVNNLGEPLPSGVYILELRAGAKRAVQKIVLSR